MSDLIDLEGELTTLRAEVAELRAELEKWRVTHADDEPSWRHAAEAAREENAALRAQLAHGDDELRRFFYYPEQATEAETILAVAAGELRARIEAAIDYFESAWERVEPGELRRILRGE